MFQLIQESILSLDPPKGEIEAALLERMFSQGSIMRLVLDH